MRGRQVRIVKNLKVNVLEKSHLIAEKSKVKYKVRNGAEDLVLKFVRVDARPREPSKENTILKESNEVTADVVGLTENVAKNINHCDIEESEREVVITIDDDSSDSETSVDPNLIERVSGKGLVNGTGSFDKGVNGAMHSSCIAMKGLNNSELKRLLSECEEKLENRKIKLADMEMKNAKKKLVIVKSEKKIKDLEGIVKIRDNEISNKNELISRLQNENDNLLSKLEASLEYVRKVPEILEAISNHSKSINLKVEDGENGNTDARNTYEEVVEMKEDIPDAISGETESLSEFLSMTAKVKKDTSDAFMNEKRGDMQEIYAVLMMLSR